MYSLHAYETLATAYHRIGRIAWHWSLTQPKIGHGSVDLDAPKTAGGFPSEEEIFRWKAYREWLWRRFALHTIGLLYVTSTQGVALKLDVFSGNFWASAGAQFPENEEEWRELAERGGDIFYFINTRSFLFDASHSPLSTEEPFYISIISALDGLPVCWKLPDADLTDTGLMELLSKESDVKNYVEPPPFQENASGRHKIGDGMLEKAMVSEFRRRFVAKEIGPDDKQLSIVTGAIAWAKSELQEEVSHETCRRYLLPLIGKFRTPK